MHVVLRWLVNAVALLPAALTLVTLGLFILGRAFSREL